MEMERSLVSWHRRPGKYRKLAAFPFSANKPIKIRVKERVCPGLIITGPVFVGSMRITLMIMKLITT